MENLTYEEYMKELNNEAMFKMMSNLTEVDSLEIAIKTGEHLLELIGKNCGLTKSKIKKANFAVAEVTFDNKKFVAILYNINGAQIMLRATHVGEKKYYIPNQIWTVITDAETNESRLALIMGLSEEEPTE